MEKETLERHYEKFAALLLEDRAYMDGTLRFRDLCSWIGADAAALDTLLLRELGLSGTDLLRALRESGRRGLKRKYLSSGQK